MSETNINISQKEMNQVYILYRNSKNWNKDKNFVFNIITKWYSCVTIKFKYEDLISINIISFEEKEKTIL